MLDLSFGLPIVVRDAALKLVAPGPGSAVNREYYAQEHEKEIEDGRGGVEEYEKTDEKARELLRRLANSEPYYKKQRRMGPGDGAPATHAKDSPKRPMPGPVRTKDARDGAGARISARGGRSGGRVPRSFPSTAQLPPGPQDILPPEDLTITSLFITGVEDDLPEHAIRTFFAPFGALRSVICSHRSHCAFINYTTRTDAETAAKSCQGKAVIAGCPLRVQWGKPRPLDSMDRQERIDTRKEGRVAIAGDSESMPLGNLQTVTSLPSGKPEEDLAGLEAVAAPPGQEDVRYASLAGN